MNKKEMVKDMEVLRAEIRDINKAIKRIEKLGRPTKALEISVAALKSDVDAICTRTLNLKKQAAKAEKKAIELAKAKNPDNEGVKVKSGVSMRKKDIAEM